MKFNKLLLIFWVTLSLVTSSAWAQTVFRLSHGAAVGNPRDLASNRFAELVEQYTEGRIKVQVGGNSQFGDDSESLTNLRLGTLELNVNSQGATSTIVKEFALLGLPFLFTDLQHAYDVIDSGIINDLDRFAQKKGLVLLALWDNGFRHLSNNVRPVVTPADMKGIKVRTPPDPMTLDIMKVLGANPAPLAFSELYIALQQGVYDGQENPLMNIYSSKIYEVQKYISLTAHKYETNPVFISKMVWSRLKEDDKQALLRAAQEAGKYNRQLSYESNDKVYKLLIDAGVRVNEINHQQFVAATQSVYDKWIKVNRKFAERLFQEVKKAEK